MNDLTRILLPLLIVIVALLGLYEVSRIIWRLFYPARIRELDDWAGDL